uniref:Sugar transporter SWEET1 n=1 Tax=Caenorhabditis tropicalis TaxID=1561998 RepID=A0A1I7UY79_9PELO
MWSQRTNALAGNIGMGICSVIVILIHYLLENKWRWGGLLYMLNVMAYAFFMGMAAMGQFSKYYFDRKRVINIAILGIVNMGMSVIILSFMQDTGFSDSLPCFSFGVHTTMAITAQVCGPRTATWNFWKALKKQD